MLGIESSDGSSAFVFDALVVGVTPDVSIEAFVDGTEKFATSTLGIGKTASTWFELNNQSVTAEISSRDRISGSIASTQERLACGPRNVVSASSDPQAK